MGLLDPRWGRLNGVQRVVVFLYFKVYMYRTKVLEDAVARAFCRVASGYRLTFGLRARRAMCASYSVWENLS